MRVVPRNEAPCGGQTNAKHDQRSGTAANVVEIAVPQMSRMSEVTADCASRIHTNKPRNALRGAYTTTDAQKHRLRVRPVDRPALRATHAVASRLRYHYTDYLMPPFLIEATVQDPCEVSKGRSLYCATHLSSVPKKGCTASKTFFLLIWLKGSGSPGQPLKKMRSPIAHSCHGGERGGGGEG